MEISVNDANQFYFEETCTMYTQSRNIDITMGNETGGVIKKNFESLLQNYKKDLNEAMRRYDFVPDSIDLLYCHLQKKKV